MELQIVKVKKDAQAFVIAGNALNEKANGLSITKIEDTQIASLLLRDCQKTEKELEEKRVQIVQIPNDFIREANMLFKDVAGPILTAKNTVKQKMLEYNMEQERIRQEEEQKRFAEEQARLRKIEEERQKREAEETKKREAEEARLAEIAKTQSAERLELEKERMELEKMKREAEEEKKRLEEERKEALRKQIADSEMEAREAEMKVKGIMKRWTYEMVDEELVPRAFCSPDSKKINENIKNGVRSIPGLRIYEAQNVR